MERQRNETLTQAMALLLQNQASFVALLPEFYKERAETNRRLADLEHRIQSLELRITRVERMIEDIRVILEQLPETLRLKIGFKTK